MVNPRHILVFEPRTEGHHPKWAGLVANALHAAGMHASLAVGDPDKVRPYLGEGCALAFETLPDVKGLDELAAAEKLLKTTGANEVFWTSLDNFTSALLRRAALGGKPPIGLRGKISGVYHRPRPLDPSQEGFNNTLKRRGFTKLHQGRWWGRIALLDPVVAQAAPQDFPGLRVGLVPDPADFPSLPDRAQARAALGVSEGKIALLHFGVYAERKGLALLLDALEACPAKDRFFLLRAGKVPEPAPDELQRVHALAEAGQALSLDEFVDTGTEARLYVAADIVTLPYLGHYGSANLLSAATAAGRPILASNHHLVGRLVEENNLGWTFKDEDVPDLAKALERIARKTPEAFASVQERLRTYATTCDHAAFGQAITALWQ